MEDVHTQYNRKDNGKEVRCGLCIDHAVQPEYAVQEADSGDEDKALAADGQNQGGKRLSHALKSVDAQEQDTDHGTGKLQGDHHLDTVGNDIRVIDEGLDDKSPCYYHEESESCSHNNSAQSCEPEHLL